ncbi:pteridine reductase [Legionella waltersii]|uniref:Pteridine reductase n=1 Tax=Legionella waltersii TaxID=66969 RepID=A0A0W1A4U4_9GAMM|nr:pteridine reductase [Legionella waltersii]KTD76366.1 pteridine reductase [Legionella waltersii]SNV13979.1 pteridine reductase 1 [Legionella waltersii]
MNRVNTQAKVALVTGGARRIGAAICKKLHAAGYRIAVHCNTSLKEGQALVNELNEIRQNSAMVLAMDLLKSNAAESIANQVEAWSARMDLLVNNASVFKKDVGFDQAGALWEELFRVNVRTPYLLSLASQKLLAAHQGVIINLTDIHSERPLKGYSLYCQTKAALDMLTKSLAREFAPDIRINAVAPGAILWPENENSLSLDIQNKIIEQTPLKRHGHPDFIAQAVLALAENQFITGQILKVDGGRHLAS